MDDRLTERLVDEIDSLRYDVRNLCDGFIRVEEKLLAYMTRTDERAAKVSERVAKLELAHEKGKKLVWMVSGAWAILLAAWAAREVWWR